MAFNPDDFPEFSIEEEPCDCEECNCTKQPIPNIPTPIMIAIAVTRIALTFHVFALNILTLVQKRKALRIFSNQCIEAFVAYRNAYMSRLRQKTTE
jgi:hypothetical protein